MRTKHVVVGVVGLLYLGACGDATRSIAPRAEGVAVRRAIRDGAHGGNPHFYFAPPIAPAAVHTGSFDGSLAPVVRICELRGDGCGRTVAVFAGSGANGVEVLPAVEVYRVRWSAPRKQAAGVRYRITVSARGQVLGTADVAPGVLGAPPASGAMSVIGGGDDVYIEFRVEDGALDLSIPTVATLSADAYTLHDNPGDPVWLTEPDGGAAGGVVQLLGTRDTAGVPTQLAAVAVGPLAAPDSQAFVTVGPDGTPRLIRNRDGSTVALTFLTDTRVRAEVSLAGGRQAAAFFDVGGTALGGLSAATARPPAMLAMRLPIAAARQREGVERTRQRLAAASRRTAGTVLATTATAADVMPVAAHLTAEGAPVEGALVLGSYTYASSPQPAAAGSLLFTEQGGGAYSAAIGFAAANATQELLRRECTAVDARTGTFCSRVAVIAPSLQAACDGLGRLADVGTAARAACLAAAATLRTACHAGAVAGLVSGAIDRHAPKTEAVTVSLRAADPHARWVRTAQQAYGPPPPSRVDVALAVPTSLFLRLDPDEPVEYEDYVAIGQLSPAFAGRAGALSVAGSDGYRQASGSVASDAYGRTYMLIPGGEGGVAVDVVTATVGALTATAWVTFLGPT